MFSFTADYHLDRRHTPCRWAIFAYWDKSPCLKLPPINVPKPSLRNQKLLGSSHGWTNTNHFNLDYIQHRVAAQMEFALDVSILRGHSFNNYRRLELTGWGILPILSSILGKMLTTTMVFERPGHFCCITKILLRLLLQLHFSSLTTIILASPHNCTHFILLCLVKTGKYYAHHDHESCLSFSQNLRTALEQHCEHGSMFVRQNAIFLHQTAETSMHTRLI